MPYTKTEFINDFNDLINGKKLSNSTFTGCFEHLAGVALCGIHKQGTWYDGFICHKTEKRKARQLVLKGKMWVDFNQCQSLEPCQFIITDKSSTKQGIIIKVIIAGLETEKPLDEIWHP